MQGGGSEKVTLTHTDTVGTQRTIDVPLCATHSAETRAAIAAGVAPKFSLG